MPIINSLILADRSDGNIYSIAISSGILNATSGASSPVSEPIVTDRGDGSYYKIFIENGIVGVESTATPGNEVLYIADDTLIGTNWWLSTQYGILFFELMTLVIVNDSISISENFSNYLDVLVPYIYD